MNPQNLRMRFEATYGTRDLDLASAFLQLVHRKEPMHTAFENGQRSKQMSRNLISH